MLLDIGLPMMDGYEVARRIRAAHGGQAPLRLIAMSGYGRDEDVAAARAAGFDLHLLKPVPVEALLRILADPAHPSPEAAGAERPAPANAETRG